MSIAVENIRRDLVLANRILAHENVVDGFGHVSVRHPENPSHYFLSRSLSPEFVTADDIMEFTLDSEPVDARGRSPYLERIIHGEIYKARPDVGAVVHHHGESVVPFTFGGQPLQTIFIQAAPVGGVVPVWDSQTEFGDTNMLIDTEAKARSLARALGQGSSLMLRGHGAVNAGSGLRQAVYAAIYMVVNARILLQTLALGAPAALTPGEIDKATEMLFSERPLTRIWNYWAGRCGYPIA